MSKQVTADASVVVAHASAGWAWLVHINEILTVIATIVAIASGIYAIRFYSKKDDTKPDSE